MKRLPALGLYCFLLLSGSNLAQNPELNLERTFADGHVHSGFETKDGAVVARLDYFDRQRLGAVCLSLPLDSSKTVDLKTRIGKEIQALRRLAAGQNTFRLHVDQPRPTDARERKIDLFLSLEYFHGVFNGDAGLVNEYREMGIRAISLSDNERDPLFAGGALTPFGKKVIALMDESGMRIDVSHLDPAQKLAVIAAAKSPVLVSHANARSVADLDYNIPDDVLAALKQKGGSVLVSFNRNGVFAKNGEITDGIAKLADHIDYFVKWLGAAHVGIGSDYQADGKYVAAPLGEAAAFEKIAAELARRGHDASAIEAIMNANVAKLFAKPPTMAEVLAAAAADDWRPLDPENTLYLELASGRVVIELAPQFAPRHAANVKALVREHYFDGLAILRVQDNYVVQWGDPNAGDPAKERKVLLGKKTLPAEFDRACDEKVVFTALPDGDVYADEVGFVDGFPCARDKQSGRMWLVHCYGMVGAGRGDEADSGGGAEDYVVIGHAPRHLDRNCTLFGRVLQGMEHLSSLPRAGGAMGFIENPKEYIPIGSVRVAADLPPAQRSDLEVLRTDTETFRRLVQARRDRSEEWFLNKPGRVEICNVPVPARKRTGRD